jgi:diguanylate cyclase (GGDEF)-like protein/PAS domain S-box-containing protein
MKEERKSPEELLKEIARLRQRISELEISETRRQLAERELRENERNYRQLVELSPDAVIVHEGGKIVFINGAGINLMGARYAGQIVGKSIMDFVHPDYRGIAAERIRWVMEKGLDIPFIVEKFLRLDGKDVYGEAGGIPCTYGGKQAILSVIRDISERLQMEKDLQESEARYRTMVESLQEGLGIVDDKENFLLVNQAYCNILQYSRDELLRMNLGDVILQEEMPRIMDETLKRKLGMSSRYEVRMRRKDGQIRTLRASVNPWFDETGNYKGAVALVLDITDQKHAEAALKNSEEKYRLVVEHASEAIIIAQQGMIKFVNPKGEGTLLRTAAELTSKPFVEFIHPEDRDMVLTRHRRRTRGEGDDIPREYEFRIIDGNGATRWVEIKIVVVDWDGEPATLNLLTDITERRQMEEALMLSERKYRDLVENANSIIMRMDTEGRVTFFNEYAQRFFGYVEQEILGRSVLGTIMPETESSGRNLKELLRSICSSPDNYQINENENFTSDGRLVFVSWTNKAIYDDGGNFTGVLCVGNDITERKKTEDQLAYLSLHDPLTGLRNRAFFEQQMKLARPPVGIIVCDVDGLKFVNDTLGHDKGDRLLSIAAEVIRKCIREHDALARIGGDEFAVLLRVADSHVIEKVIRRIKAAARERMDADPGIPLSISVGFAVSSDPDRSVGEIFKEADNAMYREKLHQSQSARSLFISSFMNVLQMRRLATEEESLRLLDLAASLAAAVGLPERSVSDVRLLARFHAIGLVGIADEILFRPGKLTVDELKEMQRHSEIGHRIAISVPELAPIADWILKHHEWWDGSGYPMGLKGEGIPVECRVMAVAEAYDAMRSERPHRKAMTREQAVGELRRCSGTQFDPRLVPIFVEILDRTPSL